MKSFRLRASALLLSTMLLASCGSDPQEDAFVKIMTEDKNPVSESVARCVYGELVEKHGQEWVDELVAAGGAKTMSAGMSMMSAIGACS